MAESDNQISDTRPQERHYLVNRSTHDLYNIYQTNDTNPQEWDDLVNRSTPDIYNIYQTYEWATLQKRSNGFTPIFVKVMQDDEIVGGQLYFKRRGFGPIPSYESLGGPLCINGQMLEITDRVIDHLISKGQFSLFTKVRTGIFPELNEKFINRGFMKWPIAFYLIDLSGTEEDLWKGRKKSIRENVKRAERHGVFVEEAKTWDLWLDFYKMYIQHCQRKGIPQRNLTYFKELYDHFLPKKLAKLFLGFRDGAVIAGSLLLCYGKVISDHIAVSDVRYEKYYPNDLILWNSLSWGNRNGFSAIDLDDTWPDPASPFYGIHKYKEKWGGKLIKKNLYYRGRLYIMGRRLFSPQRNYSTILSNIQDA